MAMIYYKFKSQKEFKALQFEALVISVSDLRRRLCNLIKLRRGDGLLIFNSQTNEEYINGDTMIPRNTSVFIKRVPPGWSTCPITITQKGNEIASEESTSSLSTFNKEEPSDLTWDEFGNDPFSSVILDAQKSQLTESKSETHLTADIGYDTKSVGNGPYSHFIGHAGTKRKAPPTGYICHRCNNPGHFIHDCPTNSNRDYANKRFRGPNGAVALIQPDQSTFLKEMEKVPTTLRTKSAEVPLGLKCPLCSEVMKEASIAPRCCMKSFCNKCIRDHIITKNMCACGARSVLADDLIPNKAIRKIIEDFSYQSCCTTTGANSVSLLSESSAPQYHSSL